MVNLKLINWQITLVSILIVSIGILVILSSSKELALQQLIFCILGLFLFFLVSQMDIHYLTSLSKPAYFSVAFLLTLVLILGIETRGSVRWIPLGFINIQPSEFAKPVLVLFLAKFWSTNLPTWRNICKSLFWTLPFFILIFKQPDLGSALTIVAIWLGILVSTKISLRKIIVMVLIASLVLPLSWTVLRGYQRQRIISFITPQSDPLGYGYNLIQSTIAVGSGQLWGRGLGRGTQSRLQFLPEFRTDFIFASIAEELGFLGSTLILALYLFLIGYCLILIGKMVDPANILTVVGAISMLLFQTSVNIGMNIGLLPITGITLPLISYGGSSLISTFILLGLISSAWKFGKRVDHVQFHERG